MALQEELEDTKIKQRIAETKLEESKKAIATLEVKLQEAKNQVDTITRDLERERNLKQEAQVQIEQLKIDLEKQKDLRSDLENKFTQTQKSLEKMQAQVNNMKSKKSELEKKIKELEKQALDVQLGRIVVGPEGVTIPTPVTTESKKATVVLEGKILVINKDYNFAVIDLGSNDGVKIDDVFSVYHDDTYVGDIKIERVHDYMSAAGFLSVGIKDRVKEGDKVVQKTE